MGLLSWLFGWAKGSKLQPEASAVVVFDDEGVSVGANLQLCRTTTPTQFPPPEESTSEDQCC